MVHILLRLIPTKLSKAFSLSCPSITVPKIGVELRRRVLLLITKVILLYPIGASYH
jgi:hypothetical protein